MLLLLNSVYGLIALKRTYNIQSLSFNAWCVYHRHIHAFSCSKTKISDVYLR